MTRPAPRYQGRITTWKDDQGYGFITPNGGGPAVFVHISSFAGPGKRPVDNDIVTYHLTTGRNGQPRAEDVAFAQPRSARRPAPAGAGNGALLAAAAFLAFVGAAVLAGRLPAIVLGLYAGMSVIAYIAYAVDKSAARNNTWRTPEQTLHLLGLAGGWPGALVARQRLRHKSKKEAFRAVFWLTVAVNCGALGWLLSSGAMVPKS